MKLIHQKSNGGLSMRELENCNNIVIILLLIELGGEAWADKEMSLCKVTRLTAGRNVMVSLQ